MIPLVTVTNNRKLGWISLIISLAGMMTHPEILGLLPERWAVGISFLGMLLQAITKRIWGYEPEKETRS